MVNTRYSTLPNFLSQGDFDIPLRVAFSVGEKNFHVDVESFHHDERGVKASWASAGLQKLMSDAEIFTNYMAVRFGAGGRFRPVVGDGGRGRKGLVRGGRLGLLVLWEKFLGFLESLRSCLLWGVVIFWGGVWGVWLLKSWGVDVGSGWIGWSECFLCLLDLIGPQITCTKIWIFRNFFGRHVNWQQDQHLPCVYTLPETNIAA